jgi:hypothetical protein
MHTVHIQVIQVKNLFELLNAIDQNQFTFFLLFSVFNSVAHWQVCTSYLFGFFFIQSKDTVTDKRINRMNTSNASSKSNDEEAKKGVRYRTSV